MHPYCSSQDCCEYRPRCRVGQSTFVITGYCPAAELRGSKGQDFIYWQADWEFVVFVVCDGVSASFCGDIAACFIGRRLGTFLWDKRHHFRDLRLSSHNREARIADTKYWAQQIKAFLNSLITDATF